MASVPFIPQADPCQVEVSDTPLLWQTVGVGERIAGALLFALALPVVAVTALAVWVLSRRSPFIAHRRVGWLGADLWMIKLRTMWEPAAGGDSFQWVEYVDDHTGPEQKQSSDPRVPSAFARFCRRHSLDELPQFLHVMRGEMSLVGPRPVTSTELRRYYGEDAGEVLRCKPGIAGLWSVSGRNRLSYEQRRALDLELVRARSLRLYLAILLRTVPEVFNGANTW